MLTAKTPGRSWSDEPVCSVQAGPALCEFVVNQHFIIRTNVSFSLKNYHGQSLVMCSFHAGLT